MHLPTHLFSFRPLALCLALGLALPALPAQDATQVDQLRRQLAQMQEDLARSNREQQARIDALAARLDALAGPPPGPASRVATPAAARPVALDAAPATRSGPAYLNIGFDTIAVAGGSTAADPSGQLQLGDHDPAKNGFSLRNAEISLEGAVDPYFKGVSNIVLKLGPDNETDIELEEAYLQTTALPGNLQLKAGQFFANFGRQNLQHPHQWAFVDQPLVINRAFGPDGLRGLGVQATWLAPTPFYSELSLGAADGEGGTAFNFRNPGEDDGTGVNRVRGRTALRRPLRGAGDLLLTPRFSASFDPTDNQTLLAGVSAAVGPNSAGRDTRTEILGADLYWKWKAPNAFGGFPFFSWQTEFLLSRVQVGADPAAMVPLAPETLRDKGVYSQWLWGFRPRWVAGLRAEYVDGNGAAADASDPFRGRRARFSPNLTFYPSEFSKLRFQYNHDRGQKFGSEDSFWAQLEFMLGAHAAHKF
jgi:hypothetical protein